jgi:hypothetical protein
MIAMGDMTAGQIQMALTADPKMLFSYKAPSAAVSRLFGAGGTGGAVAPSASGGAAIYASGPAPSSAPAASSSAVVIGAAALGLAAIAGVIYKLKKKRKK